MIQYFAEFLGTFALLTAVFFSGNSALLVGASLAFIIFSIAAISGAHVNPAVSFAMWLKGSLSGGEVLAYYVAQFAGAAAALYAYRTLG